ELQLHLVADLFPIRLRYALGDTAIRQYLDVAIREQHINEHAVVLRGIPDTQQREKLHGALPRRELPPQLGQIERALDHEPDLADVARLRIADRPLDRLEHGRRESMPRGIVRRHEMAKDPAQSHLTSLPMRRRR